MKTHSISVALGPGRTRSYAITIRGGLFDDLHRVLIEDTPADQYFIVTDSIVHRLYGRALAGSLQREGVEVVLLDFPAGEASKNSRTVYALQTAMLRANVKRQSVVIGLGGGVTGDIAGFVAATVLRGIPFIQVPTTLLSQVDSSVGGKVGIDHPAGKNLLGTFYQPRAVYIDPGVLGTLPAAEFRNGIAEIVKMAAALDPTLFGLLERQARNLLKKQMPLLSRVIAHTVGLKAAVVEKDEFEMWLRKTLNVGHTLGHAIEASTNFSVKHGAAVAMGMAGEMVIAEQMGLLAAKERIRIVNLMRRLKLPTAFPPVRNRSLFFQALDSDKKGDARGARFALLAGIGCAAPDVRVPSDLIEQVVKR